MRNKVAHHYLNFYRLKGFEDLRVYVEDFAVPDTFRSPVKYHIFMSQSAEEANNHHKVTTNVDLSCLFLNTLTLAPGALEHRPSFRYHRTRAVLNMQLFFTLSYHLRVRGPGHVSSGQP